jgi:hypothetical protein
MEWLTCQNTNCVTQPSLQHHPMEAFHNLIVDEPQQSYEGANVS